MVKCKDEDWAKFNNPADQDAVRIKSMKESGSMYCLAETDVFGRKLFNRLFGSLGHERKNLSF